MGVADIGNSTDELVRLDIHDCNDRRGSSCRLWVGRLVREVVGPGATHQKLLWSRRL